MSTAGNQTIGEAIHFGKPILALPEEAFEQRLNAWMIERMGVGMRGDRLNLTPSDVDRFMGNYDFYKSNIERPRRRWPRRSDRERCAVTSTSCRWK